MSSATSTTTSKHRRAGRERKRQKREERQPSRQPTRGKNGGIEYRHEKKRNDSRASERSCRNNGSSRHNKNKKQKQKQQPYLLRRAERSRLSGPPAPVRLLPKSRKGHRLPLPVVPLPATMARRNKAVRSLRRLLNPMPLPSMLLRPMLPPVLLPLLLLPLLATMGVALVIRHRPKILLRRWNRMPSPKKPQARPPVRPNKTKRTRRTKACTRTRAHRPPTVSLPAKASAPTTTTMAVAPANRHRALLAPGAFPWNRRKRTSILLAIPKLSMPRHARTRTTSTVMLVAVVLVLVVLVLVVACYSGLRVL
mmetsp:Transcript_13682/g.30578  ORF Transcript_13682/g.30578 Transcript_13682/m.30578 type:complete len:309 (-) Transcript_13682:459-1385(-)